MKRKYVESYQDLIEQKLRDRRTKLRIIINCQIKVNKQKVEICSLFIWLKNPTNSGVPIVLIIIS